MSEDTFNKNGFYAFIFCMVFTFVFFVWVAFMQPGIDLKEIPQTEKGDSTLAVATKEAIDVSTVANPWVESDDMIAHGKAVYSVNCAICHGAGGAGDGPAGKALNPPPRNLIEGKWNVGGDRIALYKTLQLGIEGTSMAAFAHVPKNDRWAMVHYVRSITENKIEDKDAEVEEFAKSAE